MMLKITGPLLECSVLIPALPLLVLGPPLLFLGSAVLAPIAPPVLLSPSTQGIAPTPRLLHWFRHFLGSSQDPVDEGRGRSWPGALCVSRMVGGGGELDRQVPQSFKEPFMDLGQSAGMLVFPGILWGQTLQRAQLVWDLKVGTPPSWTPSHPGGGS